jgi:hypothetical protein
MRIHAALIGAVLVLAAAAAPSISQAQKSPAPVPVEQLFETADRCQACHNNLIAPSGTDVSIGIDWRASMMAHSARDPYWQAGVRREVLDHPKAAAAIEHECSRCHMPMAHVAQVSAGGQGTVFTNRNNPLAMDGVSCTVCHQIQKDKLGTPESFTGHFVIDTTSPAGTRPVFGPFAIESSLQGLMHSATQFRPTEAPHIQSSELCATCHTLYTHALDEQGQPGGQLPEQVPYLEWRHSDYRESKSCQTCHMPVVREPVRVSSTLGEPRQDVSRHTFRGANFWMLRVLNRYRDELGVTIPGTEFELALRDTLAQLEQDSATLAIEPLDESAARLRFDVRVTNLAGHKLPTAYPSRRAWLHVTVRDQAQRIVFESGAVNPNGAITGNDNDRDGLTYEPHHTEITRPDQVQVYEDIMVDRRGSVTTGLLSGVRYVKDNRLLPAGFDKTTAVSDIAVHGEALADADFTAGGDRVHYSVAVNGAGPFSIEAELLYQTIGFRWADNLRGRPAPETDRFVRYYDALSHLTTARLARAVQVAGARPQASRFTP